MIDLRLCLLIIIPLLIGFIWVAGVLLNQFMKTDKTHREKDLLEHKYLKLKQKHEFCMELSLHQSWTIIGICEHVKSARLDGKRPKWNLSQEQELYAAAFNLLDMVERNAVHQ
jgi:hypothetical protein